MDGEITLENASGTDAVQTEILEVLRGISIKLDLIHDDLQSSGTSENAVETVEQVIGEDEPVAETETELPYQQDLEELKSTVSDISRTLTAMEGETEYNYQESIDKIQAQTKEVNTSVQKVNSAVAVGSFGIFILIGIVLAWVVWRRL
ncbi:MAG: hypothetical protein UDG86_06080 [Lachnospiraceae bacterium]|jgi:uncharacterized FlaG/YvyC family protein|nr:hypothetical protein [Lachnospiraceae bacterium]